VNATRTRTAPTPGPDTACSLVLRLAGPLQSWGGRSQFNRRDTASEPTKSGIVGLLAAAQGRRRHDPIEDRLALRLGVRTDQPGSLLRDYHTVSDYRGLPLPSAQVDVRGRQKRTTPAKRTHVTERLYLQDAVFVAAVSGPPSVLTALADTLTRPAFPLALGRRACPPAHPLLLTPAELPPGTVSPVLWTGSPAQVLAQVPWQACGPARRRLERASAREGKNAPSSISLPVTLDDDNGPDIREDVPVSFEHQARGYTIRRVRQDWARIPTGLAPPADEPAGTHDPFAVLAW
jgi:CRISPR system Cascade subunit CasD